jgi:AcrR family transcriptional regulator
MAAATDLLARALDPAVERPADSTSDRILDAALDLCAESGVRNLTMDDVSARAGVGRMTVYRRFGDRAALVEALGVRECRRCLAEIEAALDPAADPADQIADGFVASMRIARTHPLLNRLARVEPGTVIDALTADGGALLALMREFCAARFTLLDGVQAQEAAEVLVRLCVSFVLVQDSAIPLEDEGAARAFARRALAAVAMGQRQCDDPKVAG